jgi:hypothetical protein
MRKKAKMPKEFGNGITGNLFEECGRFEPYPFLTRLCEESAKLNKEDKKEIDDQLKEFQKAIGEPKIRKELKFWWEDSLPHRYANIYLTVGFALGQRIDIIEPEAQREIDFVWQRLREESLFFIYPKEKKAA